MVVYNENQETIAAEFDRFSGDKNVLTDHELASFICCLFTDSPDPNNESVQEIKSCLLQSPTGPLFHVDRAAFASIWGKFVREVMCPVSAFLVVDVQNDFITGSLALKHCPAQEEAAEVVPVINSILDTCKFNHVFYSIDWHPSDHISFHDNLHLHKARMLEPLPSQWESLKVMDKATFSGTNPPLEQILWPRHCVQNSGGAKLHADLKIAKDSIEIYKGCDPKVDSYSAFWDNGEVASTGLLANLQERGVGDVYVCGLATDVCVAYTATHAAKHNFRVILVEDACRGVDHGGIAATKSSLVSLGAVVCSSQQLPPLVSGEARLAALGVVAARNYQRTTKVTPAGQD